MDDPHVRARGHSKGAAQKDADRSRLSDRRGLSPQRLRAGLAGIWTQRSEAMRKEPDRDIRRWKVGEARESALLGRPFAPTG